MELTQGQVAEEMEWSLSKVMRIENGDVSISGTDLRALLGLYGITDREVVAHLMDDARTSRKSAAVSAGKTGGGRPWWAESRIRGNLTTPLLQYVQFEADATAVRQYQNVLVPGFLQTAEYASAVLENYRFDLSSESMAARAETRMQRRRQVVERDDPPEVLVILDESVVYREIGSRGVMGRQLRSLVHDTNRPDGHVRIRIVPFAAAAPIALFGPFLILDFEEEEGAVLYRESHLTDEISHTAATVSRHRQIFERLWDLAYSPEDTAQMFAERAEMMLQETSLDK
ncbi:transcriptional regulator [Virgisporangium aliadipatigenens]|uniref:Transcriptional regulator n=2 Tax=Virgisporangium aliadipatigenens TaxID=741659 RepID=A0A8J3YWU7_9ACTN|nr:transcriptional regulator [Virgisporangium aliadipatigenens]